jgi:DNA-binding transcriptional LysR family regulator
LRLEIVDTHPPEAMTMLRAGEVDAAIVFRYDETAGDADGVRLRHLRDDPTYLLTLDTRRRVEQLRDDRWVGGCERCREHLVAVCARDGFEPRIAYSTDDMVAIQALVAAGMGVATIPDSPSRPIATRTSTPTRSPEPSGTSMSRPTATRPTRHRPRRCSRC